MITNKTFDEIQIGDTAAVQRTLTKQDIDGFAVLSGDMNPTHFSDEYAKMLLDRHKMVGHSMWGWALISSLLGNELPGPGTVYQSQSFEFHDAVELGDVLTITVTAKSKNAADGTVMFDCLAVNQRDEKIITGSARVKAPKRKPTEAESPYAAIQFRQEKKSQRRILDYKIKIQKSRDRGLESSLAGSSGSDSETDQAMKVLADIDNQLKEFEQGAGTPRDFLRKLEKVLLRAENFLTEKSIGLRLDWMGMKQDETSAEKSFEINLAELEIPEREKRVAVLAGISADQCVGC